MAKTKQVYADLISEIDTIISEHKAKAEDALQKWEDASAKVKQGKEALRDFDGTAEEYAELATKTKALEDYANMMKRRYDALTQMKDSNSPEYKTVVTIRNKILEALKNRFWGEVSENKKLLNEIVNFIQPKLDEDVELKRKYVELQRALHTGDAFIINGVTENFMGNVNAAAAGVLKEIELVEARTGK